MHTYRRTKYIYKDNFYFNDAFIAIAQMSYILPVISGRFVVGV